MAQHPAPWLHRTQEALREDAELGHAVSSGAPWSQRSSAAVGQFGEDMDEETQTYSTKVCICIYIYVYIIIHI